jgi:hypothetical protein
MCYDDFSFLILNKRLAMAIAGAAVVKSFSPGMAIPGRSENEPLYWIRNCLPIKKGLPGRIPGQT